jgi:ribokinase
VLLQLETSAEAVIETCNLARCAGIYIILDAGPAQEFPLEVLGTVGIITPNESEALALTGIRVKSLSDADRAATILLDRSKASAAVLKLGADGAFLKCAEGPCEHFPAHAIEAVDSTAAGDAFTAALAITYIETRDMRAAVRAGNTAGALAAMEYGAQPSLPTAAAIAAFRPNQSVRKHAL